MMTILNQPFDALTAGQLYQILKLRSEIFVVEQNCVYLDMDDRDCEPNTRHAWIEEAGLILSYLRIMEDGNGVTRIGRVVTHPQARGRGLARQLVQHALACLTGTVVLNAQSYLRHWYEQLGFHVTGPEFLEDGIPHYPMAQQIHPGNTQ